MDDVRPGRSGRSASRLVLGTMNVETATSEQGCHAIMDRAHEHGSVRLVNISICSERQNFVRT
jgi:aryl-alcohol dehydrogenase-like predicted oxidoreductase